MSNRRSFFQSLAGLGLTGVLSLKSISAKAKSLDIAEALKEMSKSSSEDILKNEDLWNRIREAYTVSPNILNFNNGGVSPQPKVVQDAVDRYYHLSNEGPTYFMWNILDQGRENIRRGLAKLADCSPECIAINRNTTEALDTVIMGISLEKGDEVILSKLDYPNMISAWKLREIRDGIKLVWLDIPVPCENFSQIVDLYKAATTKKTKVYHITHMINWNGQILPAKEICAEASKRGIISVVDGAHTFAQIEFSLTDMDCDYFGTSLHKWLCAPFGTGMLYMKQKHIGKTWPLIPNHEPAGEDIRKFEALGTRSFAPEQAIGHALSFHLAIGSKVKEDRLRYLKNYWVQKVVDHPKIKFFTSQKDQFSCALANVAVVGLTSGELYQKLFNEYKIHTSPINWESIHGVRITPHVYTSLYELDVLVEALLKFANEV